VLADAPGGKPELILIASGSEVPIALEAYELMNREGTPVRVVSMPCWELFDQQPPSYRDQVLIPEVKARLAVEAGVPQGWHRYVGLEGDVIGLTRFGASAPGKVIMEKLGFTASHIVERARGLLKQARG
jgi:transketolase